ncbi:MAG TPA: AI-2E family transporter [bacterium]|nr:AI-2E family transporter [bacterium]HOZ20476.1 AI-2E family transporter [bacterium]
MDYNRSKYDPFEILFIVFLALLLAMFFYALRLTLIPPLLALILIAVLAPLHKNPLARNLLVVVIVVFLFWFIRDTLDILTPFAIAFGLAYLFDPLVTRLERRNVPRLLSVSIIVFLSLGAFILIMILSVPRIISEIGNMVSFVMGLPPKIGEWINTGGVAIFGDTQEEVAKIQEILNREVPHRLAKISDLLIQKVIEFTQGLPHIFPKLLYLILTPFLFFYLLKDFHKVRRWILELLPIETSWVVREYVEKVDSIISGFFRGQFIVCLLVGILTTLLLLLFRVEYALLIGIMAGALNIIPYVGLAITLFVGLLTAVASPDPLMTSLKVIIAVESIRILENSVLSPRIVGNRVGLHPVWVIFSILICAHFLGFVGLIFAVPLAASLKIFISVGMHSYRRKIWRRKRNEN